MTMWIEINGKNGVTVLHSYKPLSEVVDAIKGLGDIKSWECVPNTIPNVSNVNISTENFNCIVTGTNKEVKLFEKMMGVE